MSEDYSENLLIQYVPTNNSSQKDKFFLHLQAEETK